MNGQCRKMRFMKVEDLKLGKCPQFRFFHGISSHFVELENMDFLIIMIFPQWY